MIPYPIFSGFEITAAAIATKRHIWTIDGAAFVL
jgi:hypothetical protein